MRYFTMAVMACAGLTSAASADTITFGGDISKSTEKTGCNYFAELEYLVDTATTGTLTLELTNTTTPSSVGGYITGIVFNINSVDGAASATLASTTDPDFKDTGAGESASPFGKFDAGAALGGDWLGGGSPIPGMAIGATETFVWNVSATDANALLAEDFALAGPSDYNFVVRFRGLDSGGSDKVPVPAPGGAALLALGGLAAARRRR